jgi:hypothetical protein
MEQGDHKPIFTYLNRLPRQWQIHSVAGYYVEVHWRRLKKSVSRPFDSIIE